LFLEEGNVALIDPRGTDLGFQVTNLFNI